MERVSLVSALSLKLMVFTYQREEAFSIRAVTFSYLNHSTPKPLFSSPFLLGAPRFAVI